MSESYNGYLCESCAHHDGEASCPILRRFEQAASSPESAEAKINAVVTIDVKSCQLYEKTSTKNEIRRAASLFIRLDGDPA